MKNSEASLRVLVERDVWVLLPGGIREVKRWKEWPETTWRLELGRVAVSLSIKVTKRGVE